MERQGRFDLTAHQIREALVTELNSLEHSNPRRFAILRELGQMSKPEPIQTMTAERRATLRDLYENDTEPADDVRPNDEYL